MDGNGSVEPSRSGTDPADSGSGRPSAPRRRTGALAVGLTLALVAILVGGSVLVTRPGAGPSPSPPAGRTSPGPTHSAVPPTTPGATPAPAPQEWAAAVLPPIAPAVDLVATQTDRSGASIHTEFALTSRSMTAPAELAKGIEITPPVALAVTPGDTPATALLRPTAALAPGTTYRVTLHLPDGSLAGSWIFQTGAPPQIVGTTPSDRTTGVPLDTGIEITFDQDGVGDIGPYFSISPRVAGRFERHGRTAVFVPDALRPLTLYTVKIRSGVPLEGSDLALEESETFQFETAATTESSETGAAESLISPISYLQEAATGSRPLLQLYSPLEVSRVRIRVYDIPTIAAAVDAYLALVKSPAWAGSTDVGLVRTAGLTEIARFTTPIRRWPDGSGHHAGWIQFPDPLPPGWYLVDIPSRGRDVQAVLQVTDVHTTTITGSGRTVVWANDLATGGPLIGASVTALDGSPVGRTDADGLMQAPTPAGLLDADLEENPQTGTVLVRADGATVGEPVPGRASIVPVAGWTAELPFEDRFWRILYTDRSLFHPTDAIEAWGLARQRDGGVMPTAELRLTAGYWWSGDTEALPAAIVRAAVVPDPRTGVFAASLPFEGLPAGYYELGLWVGDHRIAATAVQVGTIRKPAYRLEVTTDRRVVVAGDTVTSTVSATFFDGTRAPGIEVEAMLEDYSSDPPAAKATTGADGTASIALPVERPSWSQWSWPDVTARPSGPEEGDITASAGLLRFSSRVVLDGETALHGARLSIVGSLHAVDLERLEREQHQAYDDDLQPRGAPVPGSRVTATIVEQWEARFRTGRAYDFITKKAFDTYEYEDRQKRLGSRRATTDASGRFVLDVPVPSAGHSYQVTLTAADADGRETSLETRAQADQAAERQWGPHEPSLDLERPAETSGDEWKGVQYAVGDPIRATMYAHGGTVMPAGGNHRYLFFTARQGVLEATVYAAPTFTGTFTDADVPSVTIGAAWFDGSAGGFADGTAWGCGGSLPFVEAHFDPASRPVSVQLTSDAAGYRPGQTVTLAVQTTDTDGMPVRSSVVLRAIDEKLYAIGGAGAIDAPSDLYWWSADENGIAAQAVSHGVPVYVPPADFTCGPGAGYREEVSTRDDFRDTLLFRRVTTGADGRATVTFDLSDDLTAWRVSATAIGSGLEVGQATLLVPVGLPLFIEAPLAPDYLAGDRPILRVRAYGDALRPGDPVTFTVAAPSLRMSETRVVGEAFTAIEVPLPALRAGDHQVVISASGGRGAGAAGDRLVRTMHVVDTRFTQRRTAFSDLADGLPRTNGTGFATYTFADAGRARFAEPLESLAAGYGERVDQALAAAMARDLLLTSFDADPARFTTPAFDPTPYQVGPADSEDYSDGPWGVALLPYASADVALSARVALLAANRFDVDGLRAYFDHVRDEEGEPATREARNIALAGLAGIGDPVLDEIRAALADPALTIGEQLYLALGAAALGDQATALAVERDLLGRFGQRLGPWLRLRVGSSLDDTIEATALVALVGATVGDPAAEWAEAYVEENRAVDDLFNLQQVGYITRVLERTPAEAGTVAYTVAGVERTVDIEAGGAFSLTLTPAQAATFTARPAAGRIGVAVSWDAPVDPATLTRDPSLTLTRTVVPAGPIRSDRLVDVTLRATFGPQAVAGCYSAVDVLPSGLAPVDEEGQRVAFCLSPDDDHIDSVTYRARVVTPGTYRWEPAILQSTRAAESLALTRTTQLEIR